MTDFRGLRYKRSRMLLQVIQGGFSLIQSGNLTMQGIPSEKQVAVYFRETEIDGAPIAWVKTEPLELMVNEVHRCARTEATKYQVKQLEISLPEIQPYIRLAADVVL